MGSSERADILVEQGIELYSRGDLESAIHRWRAALELNAGHAKARQYLKYVEQNRTALEDRFRGASDDSGSFEVLEESGPGDAGEGLGAHDEKTSAIRAEVLATWLAESRNAGVLEVDVAAKPLGADTGDDAGEDEGAAQLRLVEDWADDEGSREVPLAIMPGGGQGTGPSAFNPNEETPAGAKLPAHVRLLAGDRGAVCGDAGGPGRVAEPGWDDLDVEEDSATDDDAFELDYAQFEVIGDDQASEDDAGQQGMDLALDLDSGPGTPEGGHQAAGGGGELDLDIEPLELELGDGEGAAEEVELPAEDAGIMAPAGASGGELDLDALDDLPPLDLAGGGDGGGEAPEVDVEVGEVADDGLVLELGDDDEAILAEPVDGEPLEADQDEEAELDEEEGYATELMEAFTPASDSIPDLPSIPKTGAFEAGVTPTSAWFPDNVQPLTRGADEAPDASPLSWETAEEADPDATPAVAEEATATHLLMQAERLAGDDHLEEALGACEDVLAREPENTRAEGLAVKIKERLTEAYVQEIGDLQAVPTVAVPRHEIVWQKLDHRAGFLLSRIDGLLTFEDIIDISGMDEYEATRTLAALLREGIVRQK